MLRRNNVSDIVCLYDGCFTSIELNFELEDFCHLFGYTLPAPETIGRWLADIGCVVTGRKTIKGRKARVYSVPGVALPEAA